MIENAATMVDDGFQASETDTLTFLRKVGPIFGEQGRCMSFPATQGLDKRDITTLLL